MPTDVTYRGPWQSLTIRATGKVLPAGVRVTLTDAEAKAVEGRNVTVHRTPDDS